LLILPHLPAPTAIHDPLNGNAARFARTAAQRISAQQPVAAYGSNRLRHDPVRSELGEPVDQSNEESKGKARQYAETTDILGRGTTSLFFVQRYAQEEDPAIRPAVGPETAASAYPSLAFDHDILLPGEAIPLGWLGAQRLDIVV
jgi:hypothetical protein